MIKEIKNPWAAPIVKEPVKNTYVLQPKSSVPLNYPNIPNYSTLPVSEPEKIQGMLTNYISINSELIEDIKSKITLLGPELNKIGFIGDLHEDPTIADGSENLIQHIRNQTAELELIKTYINTVIEFLKATL